MRDYDDSKVAGTLHLIRDQSLDPSTTVAALIYKTQPTPMGKTAIKIIGMGSNNFPPGVDGEQAERYKDRELKYPLTLHAEAASVVDAARNGRPSKGASAGVTTCPCYDCARLYVEAGIQRLDLDAYEIGNLIDSDAGLIKRWGFRKPLELFEAAKIPLDVMVRPIFTMPQDAFELFISIFKKRVFELEPEKPTFAPDPWLMVRGKPVAETAMTKKVSKVLETQRRQNPYLPEHAAALIGDENLICVARPPRHSAYAINSREDGAAYSMHPGQLLVANAARAGIPLFNKDVYLTHHPLDRAAVMLAGAGIKQLRIDYQPIPEDVPKQTANALWAAHVILQESGVKVRFLNAPSGTDPIEEIRHRAGSGFHPETDQRAPSPVFATSCADLRLTTANELFGKCKKQDMKRSYHLIISQNECRVALSS